MKQVSVSEAKTPFIRLLRAGAADEDAVITRSGQPAEALVRVVPGIDASRFVLPVDLDALLPDDELASAPDVSAAQPSSLNSSA